MLMIDKNGDVTTLVSLTQKKQEPGIKWKLGDLCLR